MDKIILTGPIGTGKTTLLEKFITQYDCAGILTPIKNSKRVMMDISTHELFTFENPHALHPVPIGKYVFEQEAFDRANHILKRTYTTDWVIVDEIGKLELVGKGLDIKNILPIESHHILVVRDTLVEEVIDKFSLADYEVLNASDFSCKFDL